jgi:hypothetical protein
MNPVTASKLASAFAPGRVELLGNHTDYNEGLVLGAAINRGLTVSGSARRDDVIKVSAILQPASCRVPFAMPGYGDWGQSPLTFAHVRPRATRRYCGSIDARIF